MDPYGLMDAQPTKLPKQHFFSSNSTAQTMEETDSESLYLPSIMGHFQEEDDEDEFFDPYNTNTLHFCDDAASLSHSVRTATSARLEQAHQEASFYFEQEFSISHEDEEEEDVTTLLKQASSSSSLSLSPSIRTASTVASRIEQATQEASFYLQQTASTEEEALLFAAADEKATRLQEAQKDVAFYLREQFHDAQQDDLSDFEDCQDDETVEHAPLQQQEVFEDCQDDDSVDHDSVSTPTTPRSSTDVDFYLQNEVLQDDASINLEQEACPSPIVQKIASTSHRIDMDGAIRHKTVFYKDMVEELDSTCSEHGWDSSSSTTSLTQEKEVEEAQASPSESKQEDQQEELDENITRVSLDKFVPASFDGLVFQKSEQKTDNRRHLASQRIDMAGILQPTQIYGPVWKQDESTPRTSKASDEEQVSHKTLASTLKQEFDEHSDDKNTTIMTEQVSCGCGWWFLLFGRRR